MFSLLPLLACTVTVSTDTVGLEDGTDTTTGTVDTLTDTGDSGVADSGLDDTGNRRDTGRTTRDTAERPYNVRQDLDAITRLADRLAAAQNDDGSYDWKRAEADPLDPTVGVADLRDATSIFRRYQDERRIARVYVAPADRDRARELLGACRGGRQLPLI